MNSHDRGHIGETQSGPRRKSGLNWSISARENMEEKPYFSYGIFTIIFYRLVFTLDNKKSARFARTF